MVKQTDEESNGTGMSYAYVVAAKTGSSLAPVEPEILRVFKVGSASFVKVTV
jgi:hypothetical protein